MEGGRVVRFNWEINVLGRAKMNEFRGKAFFH